MTEPSEASNAAKWGMRAAALARVAGRTRQGRIVAALASGAQATLVAVSRALQVLWLEVTGFVFAVFAVVGGFAAWREYQAWTAGRMGPGRALLALGFTGMFGWFAVSSFWRSRKTRR
ncbi:MAG TPA: hypothetical protein VFA60_13195 [Terriglobales bacterium]|nr:hypothetical protein [Terriglobales bacterium]